MTHYGSAEEFRMSSAFTLTPTEGLVGGMTVQFAEGSWPGEIGSGVALSDEAFNIVEPVLQAAAPGWTPDHRYGVFELPPGALSGLSERLRSKAEELLEQPNTRPQAHLVVELAEWLEARRDGSGPVSVLGY